MGSFEYYGDDAVKLLLTRLVVDFRSIHQGKVPLIFVAGGLLIKADPFLTSSSLCAFNYHEEP
jgi:hypothetical protein